MAGFRLRHRGAHAVRGDHGALLGQGHHQRADRRDLGRGRRRADLGHRRQDRRRDRRHAENPARQRRDGHPDARHRQHQRRRLHPQHDGGRQEHEPRSGAHGHLPGDASGRAADGRRRQRALRHAVLRFRALRPQRRRPREDEHASRPRRRGHAADAPQRGHHRRRQGAGGSARRSRRDRRHRPSRQPAGALGRRADGEPVPRRPPAHGAGDPRAHVLGRDRHGHAAGSDQRQTGGGGGARVLRLVAAQPVHGPDQPALGSHPQASPLGARTGRPHARARRLRGARRAPDALRPHVPDRDAGRPEHRPDQLAGLVRAGQQVRLHRDARIAAWWTAR